MNGSRRTLLISIHPTYARDIFVGRKRVELRKRAPRVGRGDDVLVYCTSPVKALVGKIRVEGVVRGRPPSLWRKMGKQTCLTRSQFNNYYDRRHTAYGILVGEALALPRSMSLSELRVRWPGFNPPQSYWYLDRDQEVKLLGHSPCFTRRSLVLGTPNQAAGD
jgi:predicted transcriptional regulator